MRGLSKKSGARLPSQELPQPCVKDQEDYLSNGKLRAVKGVGPSVQHKPYVAW